MVERRSPKPEVVGSSPSAPAKLEKVMKNPLKFIQEVKQETFRITWPLKKTHDGSCNGFCFSIYCSNIFFNFRSNFKIFIKLSSNINF